MEEARRVCEERTGAVRIGRVFRISSILLPSTVAGEKPTSTTPAWSTSSAVTYPMPEQAWTACALVPPPPPLLLQCLSPFPATYQPLQTLLTFTTMASFNFESENLSPLGFGAMGELPTQRSSISCPSLTSSFSLPGLSEFYGSVSEKEKIATIEAVIKK